MADLTVFISYRRADSSADAGRLYDALRRRFGRENLFMDVDSLRPGEDWVDAVEGAVTRCDVLLAVIGPDWMGAADGEGNLRLHKELDRVRLEIEAALRHGKPVIPVLVEGASMPISDDLPDSLKPLLRRHAIRVSHSTFESDLGALVRALRIIDRARHGRTTAADKADAETTPLVVTPAPEPALPGPPPTTADPLPPTPPTPPPPPIVTPPYPAQLTPPPPTPQSPYVPPTPVPAYAYAQPPYAYSPPAQRKGPSGVLVGVIALGLVLLVGVGLMFALHIGPFAVAVASPTPSPTSVPTVPPPTATPTVVPPTATTPPTGTLPPTTPPTISPGLVTPTPATAFERLRALVPDDVRDSCTEDSSLDNPRLFCFIAPESVSFWYEAWPDVTSLNDEYDSWLTFRDVTRGVDSCFDTPMPLPCEGPYKVGGIDPAGRVMGVVDGDNGWMYWTHEQALVFGQGLATVDADHSFEDLFAYWADSASLLNFTPAPTP